ncbi:MAG: YgiQ family radical SAM protein [Bacteroidetes bacterium]|nr:YgiQ family radical SAM protein [Bacteroidota bacterium]MBU1116099.1 YgiQ family radical SAM protein [Bacteroidota bacterium]MBU1799477.1 YgiQ family radical SAM protein [Bacteroidota bacterium]
MFLPTTVYEAKELGWNKLDIILVSGDTYVDSPYIGIAILGKILMDKGFRVGIIAQPDINTNNDITRLGEPELFWGVTGGSVDSMVANYTASKKKRRNDDYTPGGENNRRPDRAVIAYTNLIRRNFKNTKPIIIGGIEASLRRITHYDFWSNKLRRSILFDSKADYLVYGMGEKTIIEIAQKLKKEKTIVGIRGLSYISDENKYEYLQLPSFEETVEDKNKFIEMFNTFYLNNDPLSAKGLVQKHGDKFLIQNPPQFNPTTEEMDYYHDLQFERETHPYYRKWGEVKALDTIRFSINTHRGCYGECNFCAIAVHQGQTISGRSEKSILNEAKEFTKFKNFKGNISDVGGPTANMYGFECAKKIKLGNCDDKRCVAPTTCKALKPTHKPQIDLLKKLRKLDGIKKVFVASGIRYDMVLDDKLYGEEYLKEIVQHHTSGQMKIAPEHSEDKVLELMGKPGKRYLTDFRDKFYKYSKEVGKNQFLTYYMIAAHPGCTENDMHKLKEFTSEKLEISPEQVQIFTPTPSTYSTLMYYTEIDPFTGKKLFVEKDPNKMIIQKNIATAKRKIINVEKKFSNRKNIINSKHKRIK